MEHVDQLATPPDADALRVLARRIDGIYREPVCAVIESMTGARLVHDTLEQASAPGVLRRPTMVGPTRSIRR